MTTSTTDTPTELTVTEATEKFGIQPRALHQAIRRKQVPARKVGPIYLVDAEAARLYGEVFKARRELDAYTGRTDAETDSE